MTRSRTHSPGSSPGGGRGRTKRWNAHLNVLSTHDVRAHLESLAAARGWDLSDEIRRALLSHLQREGVDVAGWTDVHGESLRRFLDAGADRTAANRAAARRTAAGHGTTGRGAAPTADRAHRAHDGQLQLTTDLEAGLDAA